MKCRHCGSLVDLVFADLGSAPPSNAYLDADGLLRQEKWYPLRVLVCNSCWLVQTEDFARREELFDADYAYFSSFSDTWLEHSDRYVSDMVARFKLGQKSHVVEVASNDGYLLQFVQRREIPCLGIEPTARTAAAARAKGIRVREEFFGVALAKQLVADGLGADLAVANNVLAHVPDINDFVAGFARLLKPEGVATFEFPHLLSLLRENQFDTIYHEHFSYLSLSAIDRIFRANGLTVFDVTELPTHGGSLRVFACRSDQGAHAVDPGVPALLEVEARAGLTDPTVYRGFQAKAEKVKDDFHAFLLQAKREGRVVAAYGAAAKGNTLMNFAGVGKELIRFVADRNPAKQGKFLPGSRIPVTSEEEIGASRPDFVVILPWNLRGEIIRQLDYIREWGGKFVTAVPNLTIH